MWAGFCFIVWHRYTRLLVAWVLVLFISRHLYITSDNNFDRPNRADGNVGHTTIDFGGQWLMGRLLVLGHGRELYSRERHLEVALASYPIEDEEPDAPKHDAQRLVDCYPTAYEDPIAGPLYPPINAFVMAPMGLISDPHRAYRAWQVTLYAMLVLTALGVRLLSQGKWWFSMAFVGLAIYPGTRGAINLAQNPTFSLLILVWGYFFIARGRPVLGGLIWGLLAFKPVWALSFTLGLLLLNQKRAFAAMCVCGILQIVATIPVVGTQAWFDWLHVGSAASKVYQTDSNWNFLSRDLFGIFRRFHYEDFELNERLLYLGHLGWIPWALILLIAIIVAYRTRRDFSTVGLRPGFLLLTCWFCSYRFMYYDILLSAIGLVVLLADPRFLFKKSWWPINSFLALYLTILLLTENGFPSAGLEFEIALKKLARTDPISDVTYTPILKFDLGDRYPWDTLTLLAIWFWTLRQLWYQPKATNEPTAPKT